MENINLHLFKLIKDLLFHPNVSYLHIFCIKDSTKLIKFETLVDSLLNAFSSPAIPHLKGFYSFLNLGNFIFSENNGLVFLITIHYSDYFYFFLFRSELQIANFQSVSDPVNTLYLSDRFFSFQKFCELNDLIIEPLLFKESGEPIFYFFPFQKLIYFSLFSVLHDKGIMKSNDTFMSFLFKISISNVLPVFCHPSILFFASISSPKFQIVYRCILTIKSKFLFWLYKPINIIFEEYKKNTNLYSFKCTNEIQVKSFSFFSEYCRSSQRDVVHWEGKDFFFSDTAILPFNFKFWFELATCFGWFCVGGFLYLDSSDYVTEIYNFMQYTLLDANVHCAFSHFDSKNNNLYFWLLFDRKSDFLKFEKKNENFNFSFLLTEWFYTENYEFINNFLQSHMSFYPIDEKLSGDRICDYRTASYYVGIYSNDFYIMSLLYDNIVDSKSDFFITDTLKSTMGFSLCNTMIGDGCPIATLREETGLNIMPDIWLFSIPYIDFSNLYFQFIFINNDEEYYRLMPFLNFQHFSVIVPCKNKKK